MKHIRILGALAAVAIGCGGNNNSATSRNNPGTGTSTLKVTADIEGQLFGTPPSPVTTYSVTVKDGFGNNVLGATVGFLNPSLPGGGVTLNPDPLTPGRYFNQLAGFPPGDFTLSVVRGIDNVQGIVVGGPGVHTISSPAPGGSYSRAQPLAVSWTTPTQAKQVTIQTRDTTFSGPDTGAYTFEANSPNNPVRTAQNLEVQRYNEVEAAGGLLGSRLRVTFMALVDPFNVTP